MGLAGRRLRILTVCGVGQGSSLILRMYVEDVLKELGLNAEVQVADVATAKSTPADLILVSPHLAGNLSGTEAPVCPIKNFTSKAEIKEALQDFMGRNGG